MELSAVRLPSVSVVLPTRSRLGLLSEAVRSVCAQTMPPAELLIIDDGSQGDVHSAIRPVIDHAHFPIKVRPGPGRGPGPARNVGVTAARGDLIAFVDDDDIWQPEKLAWQTSWFAADASLGLVGTEAERTAVPRQVKLSGSPPRRLRRVPRSALVRANPLVTSSVVARRECFDTCGGFDESLTLAQDWEMWLRIARHWQVAVVPAPLTIYRVHAEQRSRDRVEMRGCEAEVLRRGLARGSISGDRLRALARRRIAWAHCRQGRALLRAGRTGQAEKELREAISLFRLQPLAWTGLARCRLTRFALSRGDAA